MKAPDGRLKTPFGLMNIFKTPFIEKDYELKSFCELGRP